MTMSRGRRASALAACLALLPAAHCARADTPGGGGDQATSIGSVNGRPVTASQIHEQNRSAFDQLASDRDLQQRLLEQRYARAQHDLLSKGLESYLDEQALGMEAVARKTTAAALLADVKPAQVTDAEVQAFYDSHRDRTDQTFAQLAAPIREYLEKQRQEEALRAYYGGLRAKYGIKSNLPPYRVSVAATGPARGAAAAPVTIIEFGDFQCPFCRETESHLQAALAHHPKDVRLVFRELPLTDLHPDAARAAAAALCADAQGKFWEMHDAMFKDQKALGTDGLKATAARLGLDGERFAQCLADPATLKALNADVHAAGELGLNGTPSFFINGRPFSGVLTSEQLEKVIAEELAGGPASSLARTAR